MKVHLVDGTYELFRAYYGSPSAQASDGREVGAVRGLLRSMLVLLAEPEVTHLGIAFDHVVESFRNDLFAGYKTGEGIEPKLLDQFHPAESAMRALGVVAWPMVDFEADDAIATAAASFAAHAEVEQVVICSPDKDLAQCVLGTRIVARDRMRRRVIDAAGVVEKFGVPPESIPDWLALVGDSADGLPGVPRWGAKSSAAVLSVYGHLEHIPESHADWNVTVRGAARLAENLAAAREDALLYRRLATLRRDVPLEEGLGDLRWRGFEPERLTGLLSSIGDERLLERARQVMGLAHHRGATIA